MEISFKVKISKKSGQIQEAKLIIIHNEGAIPITEIAYSQKAVHGRLGDMAGKLSIGSIPRLNELHRKVIC